MNTIRIDFVKMTGAGNDFVLIDDREGHLQLDWTMYAPRLCDRRYGIGADGVLIIQQDNKLPFTLSYYNADGSYGGMCGNGGRCAASYIMENENSDEIRFHSLGHEYYAVKTSVGRVRLRMKNPVALQTGISILVSNHVVPVHSVDTGAPHAVIFLDELSPELRDVVHERGITGIGREIRHDVHFAPGGTNVDFVEILEGSSISLRTYERGVENETLACGTGSVAAALISALLRALISPVSVKTKSGESLLVSFQRDGGTLQSIDLEGPAKTVFRGYILLDA